MGISTPESLPDTETGPASPAPSEPRLVLDPGLMKEKVEHGQGHTNLNQVSMYVFYLVRGRPFPCLNSWPPLELPDPGLSRDVSEITFSFHLIFTR